MILIIISMFFAEIIPLNTAVILPNFCISYGYVKAMDKDNTCYLFGVTNDENTVAVTISFYIEENDEWKDFDLIYDNQAFYFIGFDENYANRQSSIYGYNEEGGITFQWGGNAMSDGGYIQRDQES